MDQTIISFLLQVVLNFNLSSVLRLILYNCEQLLTLPSLILFSVCSCNTWCLASCAAEQFIVILLLRVVACIWGLAIIDWALLRPAFLMASSKTSHWCFDSSMVLHIAFHGWNFRSNSEAWWLRLVPTRRFLIFGFWTNLEVVWNQLHALIVLRKAVGWHRYGFLVFTMLRWGLLGLLWRNHCGSTYILLRIWLAQLRYHLRRCVVFIRGLVELFLFLINFTDLDLIIFLIIIVLLFFTFFLIICKHAWCFPYLIQLVFRADIDLFNSFIMFLLFLYGRLV